jgi:hypothetical protein
MPSAFDYRAMARECLQEAEATKDPERKKSLQEIAKLYGETALVMDGVIEKADSEKADRSPPR